MQQLHNICRNNNIMTMDKPCANFTYRSATYNSTRHMMVRNITCTHRSNFCKQPTTFLTLANPCSPQVDFMSCMSCQEQHPASSSAYDYAAWSTLHLQPSCFMPLAPRSTSCLTLIPATVATAAPTAHLSCSIATAALSSSW